MADLTGEQLRRQGMADAVVALVLSRQLPRLTAEEIGQWIGLRQREVLDAIDRMKAGDQVVRRALGQTGERTPNAIRAEIVELKAELVEAEKAARDAARAKAKADRDAQRAQAQAERAAARAAAAANGQTIPAASYRNAGPCPACGKEVRNLGVHQLVHEAATCTVDGCDWTGSRSAVGGHRRWNHPEEVTARGA